MQPGSPDLADVTQHPLEVEVGDDLPRLLLDLAPQSDLWILAEVDASVGRNHNPESSGAALTSRTRSWVSVSTA